ncbi:unnamed protein product [Discosporangium mesarthrocarpum]
MGSSKNRKKGTMILKPATINAERRKEPMIDKIIHAIKARMPRPPGHTNFAGDSIILETQPANSPNLSVNDLGFFHSTQQLKEDEGVSSPENLLEAIMEAFDVCPWETLERVW